MWLRQDPRLAFYAGVGRTRRRHCHRAGQRTCGDRGDHVLHEYVEPVGDGGAALLAKKAVEKGLSRKPWVKTSLAPGSRVVTDYYEKSGLTPYLDKLGFNLVGYGCTTCIGNSGPLIPEVSTAVTDNDLTVCAVLSGNRNFEGRIHPETKMNFLASPPLVVAYALAGSLHVDLLNEPLGTGSDGQPVYLRDIWPTDAEIDDVVNKHLKAEMFAKSYSDVYAGDERWLSLPVPEGDTFQWDSESTYVRQPRTSTA